MTRAASSVSLVSHIGNARFTAVASLCYEDTRLDFPAESVSPSGRVAFVRRLGDGVAIAQLPVSMIRLRVTRS